jgi:hypothetical protein
MNYPLSCSYENCDASLRDSNQASKHRYEYHTAPGPVTIGGVLYNVVWEGKHVRCPVPDCTCVYTTRSSFKKHADSSIRESISVYLPSRPVQDIIISLQTHRLPPPLRKRWTLHLITVSFLHRLHQHPSLNQLLPQGTSTAVTSHDRPTGSAHGMCFSTFGSIELTLCASCQRSCLLTRGTPPS